MKKTICGPNSLSEDWQLNETGIAILPIGAFEQHGYHLPLATDTIQAEYFASFLAQELGAMLLPAIPYGTSLEHKGFRGTVSLRPEVFMMLIEDIVLEMDRQNVDRLIIINGHGGNFAMSPKVRELNAQDRKIKIIIAPLWGHSKVECSEPELHAGEIETSKILAINSSLVGCNRKRSNPAIQEDDFIQADLNTFGIGRMVDIGVWGNPEKATKSKGEQLIEEVKLNLLTYVEKRLKKLKIDDRYGGTGPIAVKTAIVVNELCVALNIEPTFLGQLIKIAYHNGKKVGFAIFDEKKNDQILFSKVLDFDEKSVLDVLLRIES